MGPGKDTHGTLGPIRRKAVGGPTPTPRKAKSRCNDASPRQPKTHVFRQTDQAINRKTRKTRVKFRADSDSVKIRHVGSGILPCIKITIQEKDANLATNAISDMLRNTSSPTRSRRKVVRKDQLFFLESTQLGCVSQDSHPRKSVLREPGNLGSKHTVKFSKGTWHQIKIRERKGP